MKNVGSADRAIRVVVGIILLAATAFVDGGARWIGLVGLISLLTGLVGRCPLYAVLGMSTCTKPTPKG